MLDERKRAAGLTMCPPHFYVCAWLREGWMRSVRSMRAVVTDVHFLVAVGVLCAGVTLLALVH